MHLKQLILCLFSAVMCVKGFGQWTTVRGNQTYTSDSVGIGVASPSKRLSVNGDVEIGLSNPGSPSLLGYGNKVFLRGDYANTDEIWMAKYDVGYDSTELRVNIGDDQGAGDKFVVGVTDYRTPTVFSPKLVVQADGRIGIGTPTPTDALTVNGNIRSKEVIVTATGWPDYVFKEGYHLPSLDSLSQQIKTEGHLPGMPSAAEVEKNGLSLGEMNKLLLRKVEEVTLYLIELKKDDEQLKQRIEKLENKQ